MKFMSGCIGKILTVILCIMLGVVITLGGIVGAGYYALMTEGMVGTIIDGTGLPLNPSEEVKQMSLLAFGTELVGMAGGLMGEGEEATTIGKLEDFIGSPFLSNTLFEVIGIDPAVTRESTVPKIGETLTSNLTLGTLSEKMGISLPDMPLFKDDEFMTKPVSEAFGGLSDITLNKFIEIKDDSPSVLKVLGDATISGLSEKIDTIKIGDIIEVGEDTSAIIKTISDLTIKDLGGSALTDKINGMKLSEILPNLDENSSAVLLYSMRDLTLGDLQGEGGKDAINGMFMGDLMSIGSDSNQTLKSIQYACIASQYVENGAILNNDAKYGYAAGGRYAFVPNGSGLASVDTDGRYKVYFYPEDTTYKCFVAEDVPVTSEDGKYYKVTYETYAERASLSDNKVTLYGIPFVAQYRGGNLITDENGKCLVSAPLYIDKNDVASLENGELTLKNRYHSLYNEEGEFLFVNALQEDETAKGILLLPGVVVQSLTVDNTTKTLMAYRYYEPDGKGGYFDGKAIKTSEESDGTPVYEYKPLRGINETLDTLTMASVTTIDETSPKIMQSLKDKKISELSTVMNDMTMGEVMDIDESSSKIMKSLKDTPINDVGTKIDSMTLDEMVDTGDSRLLTNLSSSKLNELGSSVENLFLDEMTEINDGSTKMLQSLRYAVMNNQTVYKSGLSDKATATAADTAYVVKEDAKYDGRYYYEVNGDNKIIGAYVLYLDKNGLPKQEGGATCYYKTKLYNDCYRPMIGLSGKTDELTLQDAFSDDVLSNGVLSLLDRTTKLNDISGDAAQAVQNSSVAVLVSAGVIGKSSFSKFGQGSMKEEYKAFVYNSSMTDMLTGLMDFISNPYSISGDMPPVVTLNDSGIKPKTVNVDQATFTSIDSFETYLGGLSFEQGDALNFMQNVTVAIDDIEDAAYFVDTDGDQTPDTYVVPFFEGAASAYSVSFTGGTVKLGLYENGVLAKRQAAYFFDLSNGGSGSGLALATGISVKADFVG